MDSLKFMSERLDALAATRELGDLNQLQSKFSYLLDKNFSKLRGKSAFTYCSLDSLTNNSASFSAFGNHWDESLSGKIQIDAKDYQEAIEFYHLFACKTFGEYHDIYLILDVYLHAEIFEKFRNVCKPVHDLDPVQFFSAPNLSWEAMLMTSKFESELLLDIDMLLFYENAIRSGINVIDALRNFSANNKYMQNYEANEDSVFGTFFDEFSWYAGTMQQPFFFWAITFGDLTSRRRIFFMLTLSLILEKWLK